MNKAIKIIHPAPSDIKHAGPMVRLIPAGTITDFTSVTSELQGEVVCPYLLTISIVTTSSRISFSLRYETIDDALAKKDELEGIIEAAMTDRLAQPCTVFRFK